MSFPHNDSINIPFTLFSMYDWARRKTKTLMGLLLEPGVSEGARNTSSRILQYTLTVVAF
jgi:hypothetical protein